MAHRVDRVRLVIVSSETKPLPTTPVIETLPRYELYIWTMQARDNNKTCAAATVAQSAWFGSGHQNYSVVSVCEALSGRCSEAQQRVQQVQQRGGGQQQARK